MIQEQKSYIKVNTKPEFKVRVQRMAEKLDLPMGAVLRIAFDNYELLIAQREEAEIPLLSDEMSAKIAQGYRDLEDGNYVEIKPDESIAEVLGID